VESPKTYKAGTRLFLEYDVALAKNDSWWVRMMDIIITLKILKLAIITSLMQQLIKDGERF